MMWCKVLVLTCLCRATLVIAQEPNSSWTPARCEVVPVADHQVSFRIDGDEKFCWNFGDSYPRPYFYPFRGPSGAVLTRMGHPGAPNHDHHQSIWFAHHSVNGLDFWSNGQPTAIRQKQWYAYEDGDKEAIMASMLQWLDGDGQPVMHQELVAAIIPLDDGEFAMELQSTLSAATKNSSVELAKTNFGFLAVRVAKSISAKFGGGVLTNSDGHTGEENVFSKSARWMDYSGPVAIGTGQDRTSVVEGMTCFDHPSNIHSPSPWHVRQDGWMGAAVNLNEGIRLDEQNQVTLRYLIHSHRGPMDPARAEIQHREFSQRPGFEVTQKTKPGYQFNVKRIE